MAYVFIEAGKYATVPEYCKARHKTEPTVYRDMYAGKIPFVQLGAHRFIRITDAKGNYLSHARPLTD